LPATSKASVTTQSAGDAPQNALRTKPNYLVKDQNGLAAILKANEHFLPVQTQIAGKFCHSPAKTGCF
jgi:hypothetical protein